MQKFLIGKKLGMTQVFTDDGDVTPVTVIQSEPLKILEILTKEKYGYNAIKIGYLACNEKDLNKPLQGYFKLINSCTYKIIREFRVDSTDAYTVGDDITVDNFASGDCISVRGRTIGRGFTGTIKRWNFRRGPMAHGSKSHRIPGSIGAGTTPSRVVKGKKMAGHYGYENVTIRNLTIVKVDSEKNLLFVKGSVPGKANNILTIFN